MTIIISVDGMSCGHCEKNVAEAIESVSGATAVSVDRESGTATVDGDVDVSALVAAIDEAGYEAAA